ncbi:MAG: hypothetical protein WC783_05025 [Candidatus Paceibacterota bacterium]
MSKQKLMTVVLPLVTIVALALAGYFYSQIRSLKQDPQALAQKEVAEMVAKVGKLLVLPVGETPTLATVSDPEALKDQAFFAGAQKGDKVLIYAGAKKAILYSVTLNKVIDVAPLNIGTQKAVTPPTTEKKP